MAAAPLPADRPNHQSSRFARFLRRRFDDGRYSCGIDRAAIAISAVCLPIDQRMRSRRRTWISLIRASISAVFGVMGWSVMFETIVTWRTAVVTGRSDECSIMRL